MSSRNENSVTTAIKVAGSHFCRGNGLKWPVFSALANNQQGAELNKLCGDVLVALDDYKIGLFETKELVRNELIEFKADQHQDCLNYEALGVPIEYAYGSQRLQAQLTESDPESPRKILEQIKRSRPSELKGMVPESGHQDLASWFLELGVRGDGGTSGALALTPWQALGCIHGAMRSWSENFRNNALILLYSTDANSFKALSPKELQHFVDLLSGQRQTLSRKAASLLTSLLNKSKETEEAYRKVTGHRSSSAVTEGADALNESDSTAAENVDRNDSEEADRVISRHKGPG